ncbi:MAG: hemolysin III family protein [Bacteroidia bacterium]|nr:hemolysin III family protein [Bacteroidia bacterium]
MKQIKFYTDREERANYLTHFVGLIGGMIACFFLIKKAIDADNAWAILAYSIFSLGVLCCMGFSSLYHYVSEPKKKAFLRHFDHGAIYIQIAASYAPFTLILLRNDGFWGWGLFIAVWAAAIVGLIFNCKELKANDNLKTACYVLMGMLVFFAVKPLIDVCIDSNCLDVLFFLGLGGFFYVVGAFFYALAKHEFVHAIFHIFVLLGLGCHIVAAFLIPIA